MKRVIVIGCPGSGKTTFAKKLHETTELPLYHLDAIWHKPDKTHIERDEFKQKLSDIFATDRWILDGNYNRTLEMRLKECDTVFLFDLPTALCLQGATERLGKVRCDLPWIEKELDSDFADRIQAFADTLLPNIYTLIETYKATTDVIIFKSREEADAFFA